ncbi:MAG: hypothetical protein OEY79_02645 [Anaplasmataceae bacterium]|nr:hypothetical protein [Anaplasmataceae bacterium]
MSDVVKRITIKAYQAIVNPQMASVLGPKGIAPPIFCQKANELCSTIPGVEPGMLVRLAVTEVDKKRNFKLKFLGISTSYLIKKFCNLENGSSEPGKVEVAKLKISELRILVKKKIDFLNVFDESKALKMLEGTARSMGIKIIKDQVSDES